MKITIRAGTPEDLEWLASRLRIYFSQSYGTKRPFFQDEEYAKSFMLTLIKEHIVLVAEKGRELVGFICGALQPSMYDPAMCVLQECVWWVEEPHRAGRAAILLMNAFTAWGREHADWIFFGLPQSANVSDRTMKRRGYRLQERYYLLEVR